MSEKETPKNITDKKLDTHLQTEIRKTLQLENLKSTSQKTIEAFKLVTDAQAQRKNLSNNVIFSNRTFISSTLLIAAFIIFKIRTRDDGVTMDWGLLLLSLTGFFMAMFSLAGRYTEEIVNIAERMDIREIFSPDSEVFGFIYNNVVVGVISVKRPHNDEEGIKAIKASEKALEIENKAKSPEDREFDEKQQADKIKIFHDYSDGTALITGWSVLRRYRGIGLGHDLLDKAIDVATNQYHAKKLVAVCESTEKPAIAVLKSRGFYLRKEALCRGYRGKWFQIKEYTWAKNLTK